MIAIARYGFVLLATWPIGATCAWSSDDSADSPSELQEVVVTGSRIAVAPSAGADTSLSVPPNVPIAVRTGSAKTTERCDVIANSFARRTKLGRNRHPRTVPRP